MRSFKQKRHLLLFLVVLLLFIQLVNTESTNGVTPSSLKTKLKTNLTPIDIQHNLDAVSSFSTGKKNNSRSLSIQKEIQLTESIKQVQSLTTFTASQGTSGFISTWNTTLSGTSANNQITLPLQSNGTYNFLVLWGDGTNNTITAYNQADVTHTYGSSGVYTVNITGTIIGWSFNGGGDVLKIVDISQWGDVLNVGNGGYYFYGAKNLVSTANDSPNLTGTTNFDGFFENCSVFNQSLGSWNVTSVTSMQNMFTGVKLSVSTYDKILTGWSNQTVQSGVTFDAGKSEYGSSVVTARNILINNDSWSISDLGLAIAPSAPQILQSSYSSYSVTIIWTAPSSDGSNPIVSYNVFKSSVFSGLTLIATTNANTLSFTDNSVIIGQIYFYEVQAFNSYLYSAYSNKYSVTIPATVPLAPQSLEASYGSGYVYLTWSPPTSDGGSSLKNYSIYRSTSLNSSYVIIASVNASITDFNDTSVANDQSYTYVVQATNAIGSSIYSLEVVVSLPISVSTAPRSLYASSGNGYAYLNWLAPTSDGGSPLTNYTIYRSTTNGSGFVLLTTISASTTHFNDTSVTNNKIYYYVAKANNIYGSSIYSNEATGRPSEYATTSKTNSAISSLSYSVSGIQQLLLLLLLALLGLGIIGLVSFSYIDYIRQKKNHRDENQFSFKKYLKLKFRKRKNSTKPQAHLSEKIFEEIEEIIEESKENK